MDQVRHCDPLSTDEQIEALQAQIKKLEEQRDKALFEAQDWGFKLRGALDEVERIKPLYERLYRNPFFWFIRPMDEEFDGKVLMRCNGPPGPVKTCGKLFFLKDDNTPGIHKKHLHGRATETTVWEYIKARYLGMVKIKPGE